MRYFDSANQYQALILAGNFGKIEEKAEKEVKNSKNTDVQNKEEYKNL